MQLNQVIVSVTNLANSVDFYKTLGLQLIVLSDDYARFVAPANNATFSLHLEKIVSPSGTVLYFECEDVDATYNLLKDKGIVFEAEPTDQPWLWRETYFTDPDGNRFCLYHAGQNRLHPPWRIKGPIEKRIQLTKLDVGDLDDVQ